MFLKEQNTLYNRREILSFVRQINNKEIVETKEILMRKDDYGYSVAHELANNSDMTGWYTEDKDVLMLQDKQGENVAHRLAWNHPTWKTDDPEILSLYCFRWKQTVEDILENEKKL